MSNQENIFLGMLPKSIILAMTENAAFSGAYDKNPVAFKHFNLEFLALYRDGVQIPSKPFQPEYENRSTMSSGGQSTQIKYLSRSTDTYNKILLQ